MTKREKGVHLDTYRANGREDQSYNDPVLTKMNLMLWPGLLEMTLREAEVLNFWGIRVPEPTCTVVHTNYQMGWSKPSEQELWTISSRAKLYLAHRVRYALAEEMLDIQGVVFPVELQRRLQEFSEELLTDLAGNAFDGTTCVAMMLMVVSFVANVEAASPTSSTTAELRAADTWHTVWRGVASSDDESDVTCMH